MIYNGSKRIISVNGGLGLLQMVLEPDTGPPRGVDCEISHWLEKGNKHSL